MKFEKGKKVRLTKVFYENIPVNTILTMDNICAKSDYHFLCYEYPNDYIYFQDIEEITPTLEEVKEYFKDAKEVSSLLSTSKRIRELFNGKIHKFQCEYWMSDTYDGDCLLWSDGKYAEIVSYKDEEPFTVTTGFKSVLEDSNVKCSFDKPTHYAKGIDTFERMENNCTKEECLAFAKGNIDKYNWRTKGQDKEDFEKIINYAKWALKILDEKI